MCLEPMLHTVMSYKVKYRFIMDQISFLCLEKAVKVEKLWCDINWWFLLDNAVKFVLPAAVERTEGVVKVQINTDKCWCEITEGIYHFYKELGSEANTQLLSVRRREWEDEKEQEKEEENEEEEECFLCSLTLSNVSEWTVLASSTYKH